MKAANLCKIAPTIKIIINPITKLNIDAINSTPFALVLILLYVNQNKNQLKIY